MTLWVFNLYKKQHLLLIFATGERIKASSGILESNGKDDGQFVTIHNLEDLALNEKALISSIQQWIKEIDR